MKYSEPFVIERIEAARERAKRIIDGEFEDVETLVDALRWRLCQERGIGFFDPYFEERTLDDLVFEIEMIKLSRQPPSDRTSNILNNASQEEKNSLFSDWDDVSAPEGQVDEDFKKFMETGEFKK